MGAAPANVLLNPIGSMGDVNPYLGLGIALRRRGHRVTVIANPVFETAVRRTDLEFVPLGNREDVEAFWRDPNMWRLMRSWKVSLRWSALRPMRQAYELIAERYLPGETVAVGPGWAFGARLAQERLGVPLATVHLEPDRLRSLHHTPVMPPPLVLGDWVPRWIKRTELWVADRWFVDPVLDAETNGFRRELGLPPVRRFVADWWNSPQLVIGLFPPWFGPPQPDWPRQTALTGFPLWDQGTVVEPPEDLREFLDGGEPPLVFTFGTVNQHTRGLFRAAVESCRRLGRRGVLITASREDLPDRLPEGVQHFSYVPFSCLLRHAAALVHHAGTGTGAQALAAGIPQLVTPMAFSQPDNADRLARLGVAEVLSPRAFTGRKVATRLDRLLRSPQVTASCRKCAEHVEAIDPLERAADLVEGLVGTDGGRAARPGAKGKPVGANPAGFRA